MPKLEERSQNASGHISYTLLPCWRRILEIVQIELSHARKQIHLVCPYEQAALATCPYFPNGIQRNDHRSSEITLKEGLSVRGGADRLRKIIVSMIYMSIRDRRKLTKSET